MPAEALHIELLHACPLKCLACDHRLLGGKRLSAGQLRRIFRAPVFRRVKLVSLSGGEPLLHPELSRIVADAAAVFPRAALVVLTSLFDAAGLKKFLQALPPPLTGRLHLGSSLDGPAAVHDKMRGRTGAFAGLKRSLTWLKLNYPRLSTGFTFTATSVNAAYFYGAWLTARELGAPLGLQFLAPNANTAGLELKAADRRALRSGINSVLSDPSARGRMGPGEAESLQTALKFLAGRAGAGACGAGRSFFMLSPDGLFYLCPLHKELAAPLAGISKLRPRPAGGLKTCGRCFLRCARRL